MIYYKGQQCWMRVILIEYIIFFECIIQLLMSLEQLQEATKRKIKGLFFIKSKHVHPTYKNHQYFEMYKKAKTQESVEQNSYNNHNDSSHDVEYRHKVSDAKNAKDQSNVLNQMGAVTSNKWKMFVQGPSSYGIQNTYRYMCNRIRISRKQKLVDKDRKKQSSSENHSNKQKQKHKKMHTEPQTQPQLATIEQTAHRHHHHKQRHSQPTNKYLQTTESFNYRIRKLAKDPQPQQKSIPLHLPPANNLASHNICLSYIPSRLGYSQPNLQTLSFNILPYITACFLKCKVSYSKLSQTHYEQIISYIEEIKGCTKQHFDIKDILNLESVGGIMEMLQVYGFGTLEWVETVRYFFMPQEDILNYQFLKFMDQLRVLAVMKFNIQIVGDQIYIYRVEDKVRINNIYDLLKPGTYIYSQSKSCFQTYLAIQRHKSQTLSYKNRIKKWRSVAPLDQTPIKSPCLSDRALQQVPKQKMSIQKYEKLFEITKMRRKKYTFKMNSTGNSGNSGVGSRVMITNGNTSGGSSYFVDRSKLHKSEDIFQ